MVTTRGSPEGFQLRSSNKPSRFRFSNRQFQPQSPLFSLPAEIRIQIFKYALSYDEVMVYPPEDLYSVERRTTKFTFVIERPSQPQGVVDGERTISLLLTCSSAYIEGRPLLYNHNTFTTWSLSVVQSLARSTQGRLIRRFKFKVMERNLFPLETWFKIRNAIRKLKRLQWLGVDIISRDSSEARVREEQLWEAMKGSLPAGVEGNLLVGWMSQMHETHVLAEEMLPDWKITVRPCWEFEKWEDG